MKRMHVMLRVSDLDDSIRFYSELFGAEPTVTRADYAKWMLDDPRLNFSIAPAREGAGEDGSEDGGAVGIEHLGIQAENREELAELRERIGRATADRAFAVADEGETTCCYANSDKTWVVDSQGVAWEAFYTHGQASTYHGDHGTAGGEAAGAETAGVAPAATLSACC